jgi:hypothetical protein
MRDYTTEVAVYYRPCTTMQVACATTVCAIIFHAGVNDPARALALDFWNRSAEAVRSLYAWQVFRPRTGGRSHRAPQLHNVDGKALWMFLNQLDVD